LLQFLFRDSGKLDSNSIKSLKELLATNDELAGLLNYMKQAGSSDDAKAAAYADFSEAEKYMYTMLEVANAEAKFDCMLFRSLFVTRYNELMESIMIVEKACDEIKGSEKLRSLLAWILTVVNQINTGGEGNEASGFTIDALVKLNEVSKFCIITLRYRNSLTFSFAGESIR
jgi:Formin Homology 2 Domain